MSTPVTLTGDRNDLDSILVCLGYLSEEADRHGLVTAARTIRWAFDAIAAENEPTEATPCQDVFCSEVEFLVLFNSAPAAIRQRFLRLVHQMEDGAKSK